MEATGQQARELAAKLGISVTRARRAFMLAPSIEDIATGVRKEQEQYDVIHKPEQERAKRRARAQNYHDKLYQRAMELAADVDDMDCVEHHCQGHIDRLKEFIAARKK